MTESSVFLTSLRAYVLGDAAIASLVGDRMHAEEMPQGTTWPALVYSLVSWPRAWSLNGPDGYNAVRVEVGAIGKGYVKMHELADLVTARLCIETGFALLGEPSFGAHAERENMIDSSELDARGMRYRRVNCDFLINCHEV